MPVLARFRRNTVMRSSRGRARQRASREARRMSRMVITWPASWRASAGAIGPNARGAAIGGELLGISRRARLTLRLPHARLHDALALAAVLLVLIGLHVAAVLYYLWYKRENLLRPMITGLKRMPAQPLPALRFPGMLRAAALAALAAAALVAILNL